MLVPNPSLYPPSGFFFRETDGTRFRGSSWQDVAEKVSFYRSQHGKPVGDVLAEIYATVCKASPTYCRDTNGAPAAKTGPRTPRPDAPRAPAYIPPAGGGNVIAKVTNWVHRLMGLKRKQQLEFVPAPEARRRASICAACSKQTPIHGSCSGCMGTLKTAKGLLLAGHAPVEKVVQGCSALGEDCGVSVHIVQTPAPATGLPANCWRKDR